MKKSAKRKAVRQRKSAKKETPVPSDKTDMDEFRDRLIKIQTETGLIKSHVSIALESQEKALKSALISQMRAISPAVAENDAALKAVQKKLVTLITDLNERLPAPTSSGTEYARAGKIAEGMNDKNR